MASSKLFSLNGFAYLENISFNESKCIAHIKAIHQPHEDEVYLDCEIQGALEEYLFALLAEVKKGSCVIVSFNAQYRKFGVAFSLAHSEAENTDEQLVILQCRLLSVGNCYLNGAPVDRNYFKYLLAA